MVAAHVLNLIIHYEITLTNSTEKKTIQETGTTVQVTSLVFPILLLPPLLLTTAKLKNQIPQSY